MPAFYWLINTLKIWYDLKLAAAEDDILSIFLSDLPSIDDNEEEILYYSNIFIKMKDKSHVGSKNFLKARS